MVRASKIIIEWIKQIEGDENRRKQLAGLVFTHLMNLVQFNLVLRARDSPKSELEYMLKEILQIVLTIIKTFPSGAILPYTQLNDQQSDPPDVPMSIRLFFINISYILVKYSNDLWIAEDKE